MRRLIISFSGRSNGNCTRIAEFLAREMPDSQVFRFCDIEIGPCGNCDGECLKGGTCPKDDTEQVLLDAVCSCDEAWFIVPDHCGFPCANLYIYNERSTGYFCRQPHRLEEYLAVPKRFVLVSNSDQDNFNRAFAQHTHDKPIVIQLRSNEFHVSSIAGSLVDIPEIQKRLKQFIHSDK